MWHWVIPRGGRMQADLSAITLLQLQQVEHIHLDSDGCKIRMSEEVQDMIYITG